MRILTEKLRPHWIIMRLYFKFFNKLVNLLQNWFEATGPTIPEDEFLHATHFVLSVLSYQLAEVNQIGVTLKEFKIKVLFNNFRVA